MKSIVNEGYVNEGCRVGGKHTKTCLQRYSYGRVVNGMRGKKEECGRIF
jgi:hypothetical protein